MHKADKSYRQKLAEVQERGIFSRPECWPPKEGAREQGEKGHGPGEEQHSLHSQPSIPAAAADPRLQSFSPDEADQCSYTGTVKSNFP